MANNELVIFTPVKTEMALEIPNLKTITKVENEQGALVASLGLKKLTAMLSAVESLRKSAKQPHIDAGKLIDDHCKTMTTEAIAVQAQLKRVLLDWNAQEQKRKAEELRKLEEAKRLEDEQRALAAAKDVTPAMDDFDALLKPEMEVQRETIIHQENAKVEQFIADKKHVASVKHLDKKAVKGVRKVWRFEVQSEAQVPREFLMVNEFAIRKAIQAIAEDQPMINIAGVRIYQEDTMTARG